MVRAYMATNEYNMERLTKKGVNVGFYQSFVVPQVKRIKGNICDRCASTEDLQVHHLSYDKLTIDNFQLLCRSCHKGIHWKHGGKHGISKETV